MGYDVVEPNHYFYQQYGGNYPARLWKAVMTEALDGLAVQSSIYRPSGLTSVSFDLKSGLLPSTLTPDDFIGTEICAADAIPTSVSEVWVERLVDPDHPELLAPEDSTNGLAKLFLDLPERAESEVPWPGVEAQYQMPTEYSENMGIGGVPGSTDSTIPVVEVGSIYANIERTTVQVPVLTNYDKEKYSVLLYVRSPNQGLTSFMPEEMPYGTITYQFAEPGELQAGYYTFWVALLDKETYAVGQASRSFVLNVPADAVGDRGEVTGGEITGEEVAGEEPGTDADYDEDMPEDEPVNNGV
jgi:penicillin-binding protein 1A